MITLKVTSSKVTFFFVEIFTYYLWNQFNINGYGGQDP
jgi:hypothetical protein